MFVHADLAISILSLIVVGCFPFADKPLGFFFVERRRRLMVWHKLVRPNVPTLFERSHLEFVKWLHRRGRISRPHEMFGIDNRWKGLV